MKKLLVAFLTAAVCVQGAWAALSAKSYILDGLIGHWDGEQNVDYEADHNPSATVWKDLTGNGQNFSLPSDASFSAKGLEMTRLNGAKADKWNLIKTAFTNTKYTVEIAFDNQTEYPTPQKGTNPWPDKELIKMLQLGHEGYFVGMTGAKNIGFQPNFENWQAGLARCVSLDSNRGQFTLTCYQNGTGYGVYVGGQSYINGIAAVPTTFSTLGDADFTLNKSHYTGMGIDGTYFDIRFYNRSLTADERLINKSIDAVRFFDADASQITLPAGWKFEIDDGEVRLMKSCQVIATAGGKVSVGGGEAAAVVDSWCEKDEVTQVTLVAVPDEGYEFVRWTGGVAEEVKSMQASVTMGVTGDIRAVFRKIGSIHLTAGSYVTDGLVVQFDGVQNVSADAGHEGTATQWKSLIGSAYLAIPEGASFCADGLTVVRAYGSEVKNAAAMRDAFTNSDYTVEFAYCKTKKTAPSSQGYNNDLCMMLVLGDNRSPVGTFEGKIGFNPSGCNGGVGSENAICAYVTPEQEVGHHTFSCSHDGTTYNVLADRTLSRTSTCTAKNPPDQRHPYWFNRGYYTDGGIDGVYHALRFYNRVLTADEVAVNQAVDQVRFFGYDAAEISLPDGWRFDTSDGVRLEKLCTASAKQPERGTVSVGGGAAGASVPMWAGHGSTASVSLTAVPQDGFKFHHWEGAISGGDLTSALGVFEVSGDVFAVFHRIGTVILVR